MPDPAAPTLINPRPPIAGIALCRAENQRWAWCVITEHEVFSGVLDPTPWTEVAPLVAKEIINVLPPDALVRTHNAVPDRDVDFTAAIRQAAPHLLPTHGVFSPRRLLSGPSTRADHLATAAHHWLRATQPTW